MLSLKAKNFSNTVKVQQIIVIILLIINGIVNTEKGKSISLKLFIAFFKKFKSAKYKKKDMSKIQIYCKSILSFLSITYKKLSELELEGGNNEK